MIVQEKKSKRLLFSMTKDGDEQMTGLYTTYERQGRLNRGGNITASSYEKVGVQLKAWGSGAGDCRVVVLQV